MVWAHNSHIGDARYTEMGVARGQLNIGQLCREKFDNQAALIGFGTTPAQWPLRLIGAGTWKSSACGPHAPTVTSAVP